MVFELGLEFFELGLEVFELGLEVFELGLEFLNLKWRFLNLVLSFLNLKLKWCSNVKCHNCKELFIASNGASTMGLEDDGSSDLTCQDIKMEVAFFQVNRGASPSPLSCFVSCAYISRIYIKHWMRACC